MYELINNEAPTNKLVSIERNSAEAEYCLRYTLLRSFGATEGFSSPYLLRRSSCFGGEGQTADQQAGRYSAKENKLKNSAGFSILEAVIATAVLVLALVAVIGVIPVSLQVNKKSELSTIVLSYARSTMEDNLTKNYDEVVAVDGGRVKLSTNNASPLYQLEREVDIVYVDNNMNTASVPPAADTGLKKITVTMYWPGLQGGSHTLVLTSLLSKK